MTRLVNGKIEYEGYYKFKGKKSEYGSFEVFYSSNTPDELVCDEPTFQHTGWFWWPCFPGCLPDGEPHGPFKTSEEAYLDACKTGA